MTQRNVGLQKPVLQNYIRNSMILKALDLIDNSEVMFSQKYSLDYILPQPLITDHDFFHILDSSDTVSLNLEMLTQITEGHKNTLFL